MLFRSVVFTAAGVVQLAGTGGSGTFAHVVVKVIAGVLGAVMGQANEVRLRCGVTGRLIFSCRTEADKKE